VLLLGFFALSSLSRSESTSSQKKVQVSETSPVLVELRILVSRKTARAQRRASELQAREAKQLETTDGVILCSAFSLSFQLSLKLQVSQDLINPEAAAQVKVL
jgi:hypothetical protein